VQTARVLRALRGDPLVAMRQACKMFEDLGPTLLRIGKHMCDVMMTSRPVHNLERHRRINSTVRLQGQD
jgi:hypothetical protein